MASKNLDPKVLITKLNGVKSRLLHYLPLIFIVLLIGAYSFLVFRINTLIGGEPSDSAVTEKLQTVTRPKIDQAAVDKIQQLQDNSTDVQSLFKAARDNPFQE
jgi:hypothetical protein